MDTFFEHVVYGIATATTNTNNLDDAFVVVYFAEVYNSCVSIVVCHRIMYQFWVHISSVVKARMKK